MHSDTSARLRTSGVCSVAEKSNVCSLEPVLLVLLSCECNSKMTSRFPSVKQSVGLVKDEELYLCQLELARLHKVLDTAGSAAHNIHAALQQTLLLLAVDATDEQASGELW